ncbi:15615_t:CDS:1, partial [Dentiscutata erythropus]
MTVNQYCNSGDLRSFLKSNFEHLKWESKIRILYQISSGLHFIHDWAKLTHRDFHPGNILVE